MSDLIGKVISHYRIIEQVGQGGMGVVYKARDQKLDRFVALKFLPPHLGADEDEKKRFIQEAKAASALDHPNICTIYEIDETDNGQMFIAMACYTGETLKTRIGRGPLAVEEGIDIAVQTGQGLAKAHERGIVHRDIKPANIIITQDGQVKILDFGLAKLTGQTKITKAGTTVGTVAYMSPEQARGDAADSRADIWSLGVVLYEMLTGQLPFRGQYEQAVMYLILNEEPQSLAGFRAEVPMEVQRIVKKSMQKYRNARYQQMDEMLRDLKSLREDLKSTAIKEQSSPDRNRILVLPLVNISTDAKDEYFADGMTEELISCLSKISGLRVIARTTAMQYKGAVKSISDISRELGVGTVLEGSIRKAGEQLRITVQLIDAQNQEHLWSQDYDRKLQDVFAIQCDVAQRVAEALKVQLLAREERQILKKATENLEAFGLYLKGRYYWNKRTAEGFTKAIDHFQEAIGKDPTYALAHAGIADSYALLGDTGVAAIPPKEAFAKAKAAAQKAIQIDGSLAEAHTSLGHLKMHDFDWSGAEMEFTRAVELNPNYATTYHWYAFYFAVNEKHNEAISAINRALNLDPVSLAISTDVGVLYYYARQYDQAIAQYLKTLEMDPSFVRAYVTLGSAYGQKGMYEEAVEMFQKAIDLSGDRTKIAALGRAYALSGRKGEALQVIDALNELSQHRYVSPYSIALIYAGLGQKDKGFDWLHRAYEERVGDLIYVKVDPYLDSLRPDMRFTTLLKKVGLEK